jgi:hypothetical protein
VRGRNRAGLTRTTSQPHPNDQPVDPRFTNNRAGFGLRAFDSGFLGRQLAPGYIQRLGENRRAAIFVGRLPLAIEWGFAKAVSRARTPARSFYGDFRLTHNKTQQYPA